MYSESITLAISQLIIETAGTYETSNHLDGLLEKYLEVLKQCSDIALEPRGAILLVTPKDQYVQVAQYGMGAPVVGYVARTGELFSQSQVAEKFQIRDIEIFYPFDEREKCTFNRALLLPLNNDAGPLGYAVFFALPNNADEQKVIATLDLLAKAISIAVQRILVNETLRVRELELEDARTDALHKLGLASNFRDNETGWHTIRMCNYAVIIAKSMELPRHQQFLLHAAAPLHDIGKIGISDNLLLKPGKLSVSEFEIMKRHTEIGATILSGNDELICTAREIALFHHEKWDGSGYPKGLAQDRIPLLARICAVADVFDALTSWRPYKAAWAPETAHQLIISESDKQFDPAVVAAFDRSFAEILRIRALYNDEIIDPNQKISLLPIKPRENNPVRWDDSYGIGIDIIDEHHRYLFELVANLYTVIKNKEDSKEVARVVKSLANYAEIHFRAEEQMMISHDYKETRAHIELHHAFEEKVLDFYSELRINPLVAKFDIFSYVNQWLVKHIRIEDQKLAYLAHIQKTSHTNPPIRSDVTIQ